MMKKIIATALINCLSVDCFLDQLINKVKIHRQHIIYEYKA